MNCSCKSEWSPKFWVDRNFDINLNFYWKKKQKNRNIFFYILSQNEKKKKRLVLHLRLLDDLNFYEIGPKSYNLLACLFGVFWLCSIFKHNFLKISLKFQK